MKVCHFGKKYTYILERKMYIHLLTRVVIQEVPFSRPKLTTISSYLAVKREVRTKCERTTKLLYFKWQFRGREKKKGKT